MRYSTIELAQANEKLGKQIYTSDGRVLLNEGASLTPTLITRLKRLGIKAIYLQDPFDEEIEEEEMVSDEVKRETLATLKGSFQFVQEGGDIELRSLQQSVKNIVEEILENSHSLLSLTDMRTEDNGLFIHSLNVCMISAIVGVKLGLPRAKLYELATGALMHDIGKMASSKEDEIKEEKGHEHTWRGFNVLRKNSEMSALSAHIALSHHEHVDGSGTPRNLVEKDIHLFAKIVTVANAFDHLISPLRPGGRMLPHDACEILMGLTGVRYAHQVIKHFLKTIAFYPTGSQVVLSTGEYGVVSAQNDGIPQRPYVRIFKMEGHGQGEFQMHDINLIENPTLFIEKMVE
ncbi:HD-GYP domain-containing protein [Alkalicoccobacillus murimartini]|uniref:Nucleotidyltransferase with HDIG domain n=1 Tax=Alkalicoccobacillus murimartini TaxID=171685 RepID=A0ABT9YH54_9BACI|nr:HD domain-containing phosphohydrolase [Alkalicoccobacillus murimartini]MDQ0206517.1 putative nucleotidyltransferase with HDIG domain [Alkalicoccobacillus murimartini]